MKALEKLNKVLNVFGMHIHLTDKESNKPVRKKRAYSAPVKRYGATIEHKREYSFYRSYFMAKEKDWKKSYDSRKRYAMKALYSFTDFHNKVFNSVMLFGTPEEKKLVDQMLGGKIEEHIYGIR